jgi:hypothetical protein
MAEQAGRQKSQGGQAGRQAGGRPRLQLPEAAHWMLFGCVLQRRQITRQQKTE